MICHLFDQILVIFGHFWSIFGRSGVREGLARWWRGRQRAAEGLTGSWEGSGTEVGEGSGQILAIFGPQGSKFGRFWPFWAILGHFEGPGLRSDPGRSGLRARFP